MGLYEEQGIVLRTMRLGEADRIITVLTQNSGKVRAVAKGVRKTKSRFGARLEPFTHVDLLLYERRELDIVTQADIITSFRGLREDYGLFAAGETMCEATDRVSQERERNAQLFLLLLRSLRRLTEPGAEPGAVADAFLLRLTALAGFQPSLATCAECGAADVTRFSIGQGGMVCDRCRAGGTTRVADDTIPYLAALLDDRATGPHPEASNLVRSYLEYHINRPLRAWVHVPRG